MLHKRTDIRHRDDLDRYCGELRARLFGSESRIRTQLATLGDTAIYNFGKQLSINPLEKFAAKIANPVERLVPEIAGRLIERAFLKKTGFFKRKLISAAAVFLLRIAFNKKVKDGSISSLFNKTILIHKVTVMLRQVGDLIGKLF